MHNNTPSLSERRRDILAEISRIPVVIEGTLSERKRKRGGGGVAVYHQLQRWRSGQNDTRHVPSEKVGAVRDGIQGYQRIQTLVSEMACLDERMVLAPLREDSKKKPTKP
jgi:hypothetical protein